MAGEVPELKAVVVEEAFAVDVEIAGEVLEAVPEPRPDDKSEALSTLSRSATAAKIAATSPAENSGGGSPDTGRASFAAEA